MGWDGVVMGLRYRVTFLSVVLCCLAHTTTATPLYAGEAAYPRLANYYLHGYVDYQHLVALAKWDVVILNTVWTEQQLAALRALNPAIKIYLYVCAYCVASPANQEDPWSMELHRYAEDYNLWWYNTDGEIASDWPGVKMINVVSPAARGPIGEWLLFLEMWIRQLVQERPSIDGVFFDNFWRQISWNQQNLRLDSDCHPLYNPDGCNGVADDRTTLDYHWNTAMRQFARRVRQTFDALQAGRSRPLSILSNSSSDYFESLNGTLYEFFPSGTQVDYGGPHNYAWRESMFQWPGGYKVAPFRSEPYRVSVINVGWRGTTLEPSRTAGFERHKRFTLGSTLLGNGYFSFDTGPQGHGNLWWEPEYDNGGSGKGYLGQPTGEARSIAPRGVSNRVSNGDFSRGLEEWTTLYTYATGDGFVTSSPAGNVLQLGLSGLLHPRGNASLSHQNIRLVRDKAHTLRFTAQAITETAVEVQLTSIECPGSNCIRTWRFGLSSVPREYAVSFVSPTSTEATLSFVLRSRGLVRLQNVQLLNGSQDIYRRDFDKGTVVVNYTTEPQLVELGEPLTRLSLSGSEVFDGRTVQSDLIPSGDAMIYLNPSGAGQQMAQTDAKVSSSADSSPELHMTLQTHGSDTSIVFELHQTAVVGARVFDVRGRLVRELQPPRLTAAGTHHLLWHGDDNASRPVAAGVYFLQLETSEFSTQRKVVRLR